MDRINEAGAFSNDIQFVFVDLGAKSPEVTACAQQSRRQDQRETKETRLDDRRKD